MSRRVVLTLCTIVLLAVCGNGLRISTKRLDDHRNLTFVHRGPDAMLSHFEARRFCNDLSVPGKIESELVSLHDPKAVRDLMRWVLDLDQRQFWIGGRVARLHTPFEGHRHHLRHSWTDGSPADFQYLHFPMPALMPGETRCLSIDFADGKWGVHDCSRRMYFVCLSELVNEPSNYTALPQTMTESTTTTTQTTEGTATLTVEKVETTALPQIATTTVLPTIEAEPTTQEDLTVTQEGSSSTWNEEKTTESESIETTQGDSTTMEENSSMTDEMASDAETTTSMQVVSTTTELPTTFATQEVTSANEEDASITTEESTSTTPTEASNTEGESTKPMQEDSTTTEEGEANTSTTEEETTEAESTTTEDSSSTTTEVNEAGTTIGRQDLMQPVVVGVNTVFEHRYPTGDADSEEAAFFEAANE